MFTVVNELFVDPKNRSTFEQNFGAGMHGTLGQVPGLIFGRLLRPVELDRGYCSVLEFTDEQAYVDYLQSDAFRAAHTWPDHAPIDDSRLSSYQVVTTVDGLGA